MRRAALVVVLVAASAAFYGASGPPEGTPVPLATATPGGPCTILGQLGAFGDRAYECRTAPADDVLRWRAL